VRIFRVNLVGEYRLNAGLTVKDADLTNVPGWVRRGEEHDPPAVGTFRIQ
jgi:hypothetical protein